MPHHHSPGLFSMVGDIYSMWIAYDKFAEIDPKDTVDKLNIFRFRSYLVTDVGTTSQIRTTVHLGVQTSLTERLLLLLTYTNRQNHTILLSQWHWLAKTGDITSSLHPPPNITAAATTTITQSQCDAPPPPPPSPNLNVTH